MPPPDEPPPARVGPSSAPDHAPVPGEGEARIREVERAGISVRRGAAKGPRKKVRWTFFNDERPRAPERAAPRPRRRRGRTGGRATMDSRLLGNDGVRA